MEYSIIVNDEVTQRILCDEDFAKEAANAAGGTYTDDSKAQVGAKLVNDVFEMPKKKVKPTPPKRKFSTKDLNDDESDKLVDFLETNLILSTQRAKDVRMKDKGA